MNAAGASDGRETFEKFLLAEYEHIAQAHFTTVQSISHFFQYYVLIASLPISVAVALGKLESLTEIVRAHATAIAVGLSLIALVGLAVMGYIVNLRADAVLYARTINGLRKYFIEQSDLSLRDEFRVRVLPRSVYFPRYRETWYFGFVVAAFALLDSVYGSAGWWMHFRVHPFHYSSLALGGILVFLLALHIGTYWAIARHREFGYLRGHIIGVDLDGVLGKHREQFCRILKEERKKAVDPLDIKRIPVHECPGLDVTEEDEVAVFHQPGYWLEMPPYEDASYVLKRLRGVLHYRVLIFSWRPWPNWPAVPAAELEACRAQWRGLKLTRITSQWLAGHGIPYDALIIERGNVDSPDRAGKVRNRYTVSQDRRIRLFVEDDLDKARRLADICEVVFLIKHPYNQERIANETLPNNIVPVCGWKEIWRYVRSQL